MIEPEQAVQPVGILLVALQPIDERQLLIDQRTAAPRHGLEHVVDQQTQPRLVAGQQQGLGVQFVDRVRDLADLLRGVHRQWHGDRFAATGLDQSDLFLEIGMGDPERAVAQRAQRPDQSTGHQQHDDQCDHNGRQHQGGVQNRGITPISRLGLH